MERNADGTFGATGDQSSTGGTNSFGTTGSGMAGSTTPAGGSSNTPSDIGGQTSRADQAKATAQDKLGQVKEKARNLQSTLADRLDTGAEKLRQRKQNATLAGATESGNVGLASDERIGNVQDSVARGMSKSADWLRNGDMKADLEKQVRENPGRTLLIALGVGYVLGKAFRNNR